MVELILTRLNSKLASMESAILIRFAQFFSNLVKIFKERSNKKKTLVEKAITAESNFMRESLLWSLEGARL